MKKVTQCQRQGSEGHDLPHDLPNLESKLLRQAMTWDEKIQIPKLELRGVNEKVR